MCHFETLPKCSLILTGGLQIRTHLRKYRENTNSSLLSFCYSAHHLHLSIPLRFTLTYPWERAGGQFRCNNETHRHTLYRLCFLIFSSHMQRTQTYATHSQCASACKELHQCPWAAGSEVIMRARSICSLTPAVCLDYRNINRPGLTESLLQPSHCQAIRPQKHTAVCQATRENATWSYTQWTMDMKVVKTSQYYYTPLFSLPFTSDFSSLSMYLVPQVPQVPQVRNT